MALVLRLSRRGTKKQPFYRIVATEKQSRRDGRYIELVGTYNPMLNPPVVSLKTPRIEHWLNVGAIPSQLVRNLILKNMPGILEPKEERRLKRKQAARKARKLRAAKAKKGK